MRVVLIVIALVIVGFLAGWLSFSKGPDRSSVNIETNWIRADAEKAIQSSADLLHKAGDEIENESSRQKERAPTAEDAVAPITR